MVLSGKFTANSHSRNLFKPQSTFYDHDKLCFSDKVSPQRSTSARHTKTKPRTSLASMHQPGKEIYTSRAFITRKAGRACRSVNTCCLMCANLRQTPRTSILLCTWSATLKALVHQHCPCTQIHSISHVLYTNTWRSHCMRSIYWHGCGMSVTVTPTDTAKTRDRSFRARP